MFFYPIKILLITKGLWTRGRAFNCTGPVMVEAGQQNGSHAQSNSPYKTQEMNGKTLLSNVKWKSSKPSLFF
jgi:hypothetical protein